LRLIFVEQKAENDWEAISFVSSNAATFVVLGDGPGSSAGAWGWQEKNAAYQQVPTPKPSKVLHSKSRTD
jgi:hypothetical protein